LKSISLKVTVWSVAASVISLAVFILIGNVVIGKSAGENFSQVNRVLFQQASAAYRSGGPDGLRKYMRSLNQLEGTSYVFADASGRDLVTGNDDSALVRATVGSGHSTARNNNRMTMGLLSGDGRYIWLVTTKGSSQIVFTPFYILLLATVAVLYWLVTAYITQPVRQLAGVVDRFGHGELTVRAAPRSNDEIGNLCHSFNTMAERIQTLLTTERQLLHDVSHELRSPLARLTFEAEMVRNAADRDAAATRLRREIDRLSELVGSLIEMACAEGDPGTIEMEDLCLNGLIAAIAEDCAIEAEARGCAIALDAPKAVSLWGNTELLRRAIENVVRNAIRFAPRGTSVEIGLLCAGGRVVITVRDRGSGIPSGLTERIFDPFFRADSSREESSGGLGLGLAIAQRAVRVHRGSITAFNASPGALLRIELPFEARAE